MIRGEEKKIALVAGEVELTYNELGQKISFYASQFNNYKNINVAIYSDNKPEWVYTFYAIWMNQCIAVPIDYMAGVEDVAFILNDCRPEIIFCSREKFSSLKEAAKLVKVNQ